MIRHSRLLVCLGALLLGCSSNTSSTQEDDSALASPDAEVADLDALTEPRKIIAAVFDEAVRHAPSSAVFAGVRTYDAELDDLRPAEFRKYFKRMHKLEEKLRRIDVGSVAEKDLLAYDEALTTILDAKAIESSKAYLWEVSTIVDVGSDALTFIPGAQTIRNQADVDNLIARYKKIPVYLKQRQENLEAGSREGLTAAKTVVEAAAANAEGYAAKMPDSAFAPVFDDAVTASDQARWSAAIGAVVDSVVAPAMAGYAAYLKGDLASKSRSSFGYGALGTVGAKYYADRVAFHTGTAQTPQQLHDLGEARVKEIEGKLREQLTVLGITEVSLADALTKARALPEAAAASPDAVKAYGQALVESLRAPSYSEALWGVPSPAAPTLNIKDATGSPFYVAGTNAITLFVKDTSLETLDPTLTHEFTHYLQDLVNKPQPGEQPLTPYLTVFGGYSISEGGAHYAEVVALGTNRYDKPEPRKTALVKLDALSDLMLRAVRLVVDTGIHAFNMTREDAIAYMKARTLNSDDSIAFEVNRYASWPGQALAYRVGMEGIADQRKRAQAALGSRFLEKDFNRVVLESSGGSLNLLRLKTDAFIRNTAR